MTTLVTSANVSFVLDINKNSEGIRDQMHLGNASGKNNDRKVHAISFLISE